MLLWIIIGTIIWFIVGIAWWFFDTYEFVSNPSYDNGYHYWKKREVK